MELPRNKPVPDPLARSPVRALEITVAAASSQQSTATKLIWNEESKSGQKHGEGKRTARRASSSIGSSYGHSPPE
jgi:hypothetical protein